MYSALWAYRTSVRNATGFAPFQLVYVLEAIFPIQCEISSLKLIIDMLPNTSSEESCIINLIHLDEMRREAKLAYEVHKRRIRRNTTNMSSLTSSQRATWSYFMIRKLM